MSKNIVDIFIRTFYKDFEILDKCLYTIKKYVKGYRDIIVCVKQREQQLLTKSINTDGVKIVVDANYPDNVDYCGQQICKMNADFYTDADYVLYLDSDCEFCPGFDIEKTMFDDTDTGKILIIKDYWASVGDANVWKGCLNEVKLLTEFEFMRRLPLIYPTSILVNLREYIKDKIGKDFINSCFHIYSKCKLSEFNIMYSFLYLHHPDKMTTKFSKDAASLPFVQHWSHGIRKIK